MRNISVSYNLIYYVSVFIVVATSVCLFGIGSIQSQIANAQLQPQVNLTSTERQHLLDGISFQIDNVTFTHHMATVNGIQLHYVMGGKGDPIVLL
ncbi:MAG: hypothetical protein WB664_11550, partial [Nitrososphaeraceae archaeon]